MYDIEFDRPAPSFEAVRDGRGRYSFRDVEELPTDLSSVNAFLHNKMNWKRKNAERETQSSKTRAFWPKAERKNHAVIVIFSSNSIRRQISTNSELDFFIEKTFDYYLKIQFDIM